MVKKWLKPTKSGVSLYFTAKVAQDVVAAATGTTKHRAGP